MSTPQRDPLERSLLAGEYVLGSLTAEERRSVEREAAWDPALRADLRWWEIHLAPLARKLAPLAPSPLVWLKLLREIAPPARAATTTRPPRALRAWAALATAASLLLGFALYREMTAPPPAPVVVTERVPVAAPTYVALLQVPKSNMQWMVTSVGGKGQLAMHASGDVPAAAAKKDAELWLITDKGPVSLGLMPKKGDVQRGLPAGLAIAPGATLAVSLEPPGGSKTGQPTGPVITTTKVVQAG